MKYIKCILIICLLSLVLINTGLEAMAMNTGFSTEQVSKETFDKVTKNTNLSLLETEPERMAIECFDVSDNGKIALGYKDNENQLVTIAIYKNDDMFDYGYTFLCSGSFAIEFDNECLLIYLVRSDLVLAVDSSGIIKEMRKISRDTENTYYWNEVLYSEVCEVGDTKYIIRNDLGFFNFFASTHSQLIKIDPDGKETILHDVNDERMEASVNMLILIIVTVVCTTGSIVTTTIIIYKMRKKGYKIGIG